MQSFSEGGGDSEGGLGENSSGMLGILFTELFE